jgi:hypothetical protein
MVLFKWSLIELSGILNGGRNVAVQEVQQKFSSWPEEEAALFN